MATTCYLSTIQQAIEALERFRRTNDEDALNEAFHYLRSLRPATEEEIEKEFSLIHGPKMVTSDWRSGFRAAERFHGIGEKK